jgi:hypothetical protein
VAAAAEQAKVQNLDGNNKNNNSGEIQCNDNSEVIKVLQSHPVATEKKRH